MARVVTGSLNSTDEEAAFVPNHCELNLDATRRASDSQGFLVPRAEAPFHLFKTLASVEETKTVEAPLTGRDTRTAEELEKVAKKV